MKEKKTEEVIEMEVNDKLLEYLKFARTCSYQFAYFTKACKVCYTYCANDHDDLLKLLGLDTSEPVTIKTGYNEDTIYEAFLDFISKWIDEYNNLDLTKLDNYTKYIIESLLPLPCEIAEIKKKFEKCD